MMRQKMVRIALGMLRRGSSLSPAATPTSSVPWKENPAIMNTETTESQPPANGASPVVQLLNPGLGLAITPAIISTPSTRNTTTVATLMAANQNSPSPKARADRAFRPVSSTRNTAAQIQLGTSGSQ